MFKFSWLYVVSCNISFDQDLREEIIHVHMQAIMPLFSCGI